jgi:hypothetical protein
MNFVDLNLYCQDGSLIGTYRHAKGNRKVYSLNTFK